MKNLILILTLFFTLTSCSQVLETEMSSKSSSSIRAVSSGEWISSKQYLGGSIVHWANHKWESEVWTQGNEPGTGSWSPWKDLGVITIDTIPPTNPGIPVVANITSNEASISWSASTDNIDVNGYRVKYRISLNNYEGVIVNSNSFQYDRLRPLTDYTVNVIAIDGGGLESQVSSVNFTTPDGNDPAPMTRGEIDFHLHLGVKDHDGILTKPQDKLVLNNDAYTDLIMSNFVAGVMYGHLVKSYYPGIQYDRDFMYGSIMGQLLQENLGTHMYDKNQDLISPHPDQQCVMGQAQGGPYQINYYAADMKNGSYTPGGHSLINMVALQKNIGFTMEGAPTQHLKTTPQSFNNKYFSPILTAYFHYLDFVGLIEIGKLEEGGWETPWQTEFDQALINFKTLPNNFLDVLLNVAYNQGFYGPLMKRYSEQAMNATASTIAEVRDWGFVWGKTDTYEQYPFQVQYYLYQMYGKPIPTTSPTTLIVKDIEIAFTMTELEFVFSKVFQTLGYVNGSGQYVTIPQAEADSAFASALAANSVSSTNTLHLNIPSERSLIFSILEDAISNLESSLGTSFIESTMNQL